MVMRRRGGQSLIFSGALDRVIVLYEPAPQGAENEYGELIDADPTPHEVFAYKRELGGSEGFSNDREEAMAGLEFQIRYFPGLDEEWTIGETLDGAEERYGIVSVTELGRLEGQAIKVERKR